MIQTILAALAILTAIAGTVLMYIFILPEKKRNALPKVFQFVSDFFNFKELYLEKILRALYTVSTVFCVVYGALLILFGFSYNEWTGLQWQGGTGILIILVGTIMIRITYEGLMMFVLLVKNTIQINNKMKAEEAAPAVETVEE